MENNNPMPQAPIKPNMQPNPLMSVAPKEDSPNMVMWLVGGVILIIFVVGGIYFYLSKQQTAQPTFKQNAQATLKPEDTVDALDKDLSSVNISNLDSDFSQVDQDLQNL